MTWHAIVVAAALAVGGAVRAAAGQQLADERTRREAMDLYRVGADALAAERFTDAVEAFSKAVEKDPLFTLAHYSLGRAYMQLQEFDPAIDAFNASIEASRTLFTLQQTHRFEVEKQRDAEIQELREVIRRGGRTPTIMQLENHLKDLESRKPSLDAPFQPPAEVLLSLGSAHLRAGRPDVAEEEWKAAIAVNPKLGEAHNNLAVIYMQTGRFDEAEQEIRAAERSGLRVNPQFKEDLKKRREASRP